MGCLVSLALHLFGGLLCGVLLAIAVAAIRRGFRKAAVDVEVLYVAPRRKSVILVFDRDRSK
jgi:NhaP-type Na+/H+ or K+/H+ antiporter